MSVVLGLKAYAIGMLRAQVVSKSIVLRGLALSLSQTLDDGKA